MTEIKSISFLSVLKVSILPIFIASLGAQFLQQMLTLQITQMIKSSSHLSPSLWIAVGLLFIFSLLFPLLQSLIVLFLVKLKTQPHLRLITILKNDLEQSTIEYLRSMGVIFLWMLLLIIPGFFKFLAYLPVLFVVVFSKKYFAGEVDALKYAQIIASRMKFKILSYVLVFSIIIPILLTAYFEAYSLFSEHPLKATLLTLFESFIFIIYQFFLINDFFKILCQLEPDTNSPPFFNNGEHPHGPHVQLD